jgi:hypothetical protein
MAENEAVFPIRYPTDTSGLSKGVTELERLRAALQEDQKQIAGLQKAMASLKLDPDVQAFQKMQDELKKLGVEEEKAAAGLKKLQAQRADMVNKGASAGKLAEFDVKGGDAVGKLWKTQERIQGLKKSMGELDSKPAVRQFKDLGLALKDNEGRLAENQSKYLALGGDMTKMGDKVKSGWEKLSEGADQAGGGIGALKSKFEALKALGPAGIVAAIVVTIVALGIALAKCTFDLVRFAIESGDAARSMGIMMEAAGGSVKGGKELGGMVGRLRKDFAGSREEIAGMVLELRRSGLEGIHLEKTVRLAGIATKTMGEAAGGILKGLIDKGHLSKRFVLNPFDLRGTGLVYDDVAKQLAKKTNRTMGVVKAALYNGQVKLTDGIDALDAAVKEKFGDLAKRQLLAIPEQAARARENLKNIFSGIKVDKFLEGMDKVLGLLDETTTTGQILRALAKTIFQPIVDFVGSDILPKVRIFFIGMSIAILDVVNTSLKAYIWFKKTFGDVGLFKGIDGAAVAFAAGKAAVYALVVGVGILLAVFAALGTMVAYVTAPIWQFIAAAGAAVAAATALKTKIATALGGTGDSTKDAGNDAAKGIADGIKDGAPAVNAAMVDLAKGGKEAFEGELKIASPSKEMRATAKAGIGPGVAQGIDDGGPVVDRAMSRLVDPQSAIPQGGNATRTGGSGGDTNVYIDKIIIGGDGKITAPSRASLITELTEIFGIARLQAAMVAR